MSCHVTWCDFEGDLPDKEDPVLREFQWEIVLGTFSDWFRNETLGMLEGNTPTFATQYYIAVHSTACSSATPGTELLAADGYGRVPVTFERVSDIQRWNSLAISTASATSDWTVASFSIWDSATIGGGNYYAFGNLDSAQTVAAGKGISWAKNKIIVGMGSAP